jgi:hypothetical protein
LFSPVIVNNPPISVSCSPTFLGSTISTAGGLVGTLVVTATGGVGTLSYQWTKGSVEGSGNIIIETDTLATTNINCSGLGYAGAYAQTTVTCTITDSRGTTAFVNVSVGATRTSGGGIPP